MLALSSVEDVQSRIRHVSNQAAHLYDRIKRPAPASRDPVCNHRRRTTKGWWQMYNRTRLVLALAALAVGLLVAAGQSADKKPDAKPGEKQDTPKLSPEDIARAKRAQQLAGAYALIEYGRGNKAPEALITAARIIGTTPAMKGREADAKDKDKAEPDDSGKEVAEKLLKEATALAADTDHPQQEHLEALAKATRKLVAEQKRGPVGGPRNYPSKPYNPGETKQAVVDLIGGYTTVTARRFDAGLIRVRVVGELTGLEYANQSGWGTVTVGFSHLPIAKVKIIVTNESGAGFIQTSVY